MALPTILLVLQTIAVNKNITQIYMLKTKTQVSNTEQ